MNRLHCSCGKVMGKMTMEYPERVEELYVCISCFRQGDDNSSYIKVKDADKLYPDWNKKYREEHQKFWRRYRLNKRKKVK